MSYFTPAQEYFRGLMGVNTKPMFQTNVLQGLQQMPPQSMAPTPMGPAPMAPAPQNSMPQAPAMPQQDNPITKGLSAGMQTARDSIDWDDDQKSQMMGLAIAKMFGGLSANQGQHPTVLGGLNLGLRDAVNSMGDERERIWKMNKMQLDRQDMIEKELQRRKELQEEMGFKRQVHQDEMGFKNKQLAEGMTPYQQQALALRAQELALKKGAEYNPNNVVDLGDGEQVDLGKIDVTQYKPFGNNKKIADQVAKERITVDEQLSKVDEAINLYKEYIELKKDKNAFIDPQSPIIGNLAKKFYNATGVWFNNKDMQELANSGMLVDSLFGKLRAQQERSLEGGNLKQGLTKYYEQLKLYADPAHMTDPQVLNSANRMRNDLKREKIRLELSNRMGRHITESEANQILEQAMIRKESNQDAKPINPQLLQAAKSLDYDEDYVREALKHYTEEQIFQHLAKESGR